jgi:hypothetical protein
MKWVRQIRNGSREEQAGKVGGEVQHSKLATELAAQMAVQLKIQGIEGRHGGLKDRDMRQRTLCRVVMAGNIIRTTR